MTNTIKIDLIVPIHGQRAMNQVFFEYLLKNTKNPFRLIVVDNFSQDESAEFFEQKNADLSSVVVIRNAQNQCYPVSINQGVQAGKAPIIGLLNNDILVAPGWDEPLVNALLDADYPVVSPAGLEHFPDQRLEELIYQRWKIINRKKWSEDKIENIRKKIVRMYGDFDDVTSKLQMRFHGVHYKGIMGHCHLLKRETFEALNGLDPRIQAADWDLYLTIEKMKRMGVFTQSPMIIGDSFVHHFIRLTDSQGKRMPVYCTHSPHIKLEEKWRKKDIQDLWPFKDQVPESRKEFGDKLHKKMIKLKTKLYLWRVKFEQVFLS